MFTKLTKQVRILTAAAELLNGIDCRLMGQWQEGEIVIQFVSAETECQNRIHLFVEHMTGRAIWIFEEILHDNGYRANAHFLTPTEAKELINR